MSNYRLKAAAILTTLICGGLILYEPPKPEIVERPQKVEKVETKPENSRHGFGYVDLEQILQKHSKGEQLKELQGREIRLRLELNELMRPVSPPKLPEIDTAPFEESAREKKMQEIISSRAELKARKKRLAAEYQKDSEPKYIERRNAIRDFYANEVFNISLKLENKEKLHLTQEEVQEYAKRLDELTLERNDRQFELLEEWKAEIENYVEEQTAADEERLRQESVELEQRYSAEAIQKLRETQARNKALMDAAIQEVAFRNTRRQEILDQLIKTTAERAKLENEIIDSIAGEVGKLGSLYKVHMVFIRSEKSYADEELSKGVDMTFRLTTPKSPGVVIFEGADTHDLTKDLLKTIR